LQSLQMGPSHTSRMGTGITSQSLLRRPTQWWPPSHWGSADGVAITQTEPLRMWRMLMGRPSRQSLRRPTPSLPRSRWGLPQCSGNYPDGASFMWPPGVVFISAAAERDRDRYGDQHVTATVPVGAAYGDSRGWQLRQTGPLPTHEFSPTTLSQ